MNRPVNAIPGRQGFQPTGITADQRASAPTPPATGFVFNGDRDDLEQVAPFFDDYADAVQYAAANDHITRLDADKMRGRIPAIAGPDEDAALRMLARAWHRDWERRGTALAAEHYDEFVAVYDEIVDGGDYPYNSLFQGRIPGLAGQTDKNPGVQGVMEDHVIYLMQGMRRIREMQTHVDAFIAEGAEPIETVTGTEPFRKVMSYGFYVGGTGMKVHENVRLQAPTSPGGPMGIIPKGGRAPIDYTAGTVLGLR